MLRALKLKTIVIFCGLDFALNICAANFVSTVPVSFVEKARNSEIVVEGEITKVTDFYYSVENKSVLCGFSYTIAVKQRFKGNVPDVFDLSSIRPLYRSPEVAPAIGDHVLVLAKRLKRGESWYSRDVSSEENRCRYRLGGLTLTATGESVFQIIESNEATAAMLLYSEAHTKWSSIEEDSDVACANDPRAIARRCIAWDRVRQLLLKRAQRAR